MALWGVTRVENGRSDASSTSTRPTGTASPAVTRGPGRTATASTWSAGRGPTVAPDARAVPAYASAKVNDSVTIGAYAGSPILEPSGSVFGVLCGIDPSGQGHDEGLAEAAPLLALLGQLLSMVLAADRTRDLAVAAALEANLTAETDSLTGLYNRRAWGSGPGGGRGALQPVRRPHRGRGPGPRPAQVGQRHPGPRGRRQLHRPSGEALVGSVKARDVGGPARR